MSKETENLLFLWGIYSLTSVADYTRNILETDLSLSLSLRLARLFKERHSHQFDPVHSTAVGDL